jgi:hypothetical protein
LEKSHTARQISKDGASLRALMFFLKSFCSAGQLVATSLSLSPDPLSAGDCIFSPERRQEPSDGIGMVDILLPIVDPPVSVSSLHLSLLLG